MKRLVSLLLLVGLFCVGCQHYPVTLSRSTEVFHGSLMMDSESSGVIELPNGPDGESFTGRYTANVSKNAPGLVAAAGSPNAEPTGIWVGRGTRGSTLRAEIKLGHQGHGIGTAKHSNGKEFEIAF